MALGFNSDAASQLSHLKIQSKAFWTAGGDLINTAYNTPCMQGAEQGLVELHTVFRKRGRQEMRCQELSRGGWAPWTHNFTAGRTKHREFATEYRPSRLKLDICSFYPCAAICEIQPKLLLNHALRTRRSCAGLLDIKQAKENLATAPSLCKNHIRSQVCCSEESLNIFTWLSTRLWPWIPKCKFWVSQLRSEETLQSPACTWEHRPALWSLSADIKPRRCKDTEKQSGLKEIHRKSQTLCKARFINLWQQNKNKLIWYILRLANISLKISSVHLVSYAMEREMQKEVIL